ncbi:MAG: transporter, partial [Thermotoga sp.]
LPYIGKVKAKSILEYREKHGPFRKIEDILKVPGIGPKTFDRIKDKIFVRGGE